MSDPARMSASDPHDLGRFVEAQAPVIDRVRAELQAGAKRSHWMWFVFPQIHGLGFSAMAERYAISGLDEAVAYLAHPVLGPRLRECVRLVLAAPGRSATAILGTPDDRKLQSSVTLFDIASSGEAIFGQALDRFFGGLPDQATLNRLRPRTAPRP